MKIWFVIALFFVEVLQAAEPIYSGPQIGEKTTPFPVLELWGPNSGTKREPITENGGTPTALIFINEIERSMVPLLRVIDGYGEARSDRLKVEVVFLFPDRVQGEQRVKAAANSIKLHSRVGLSLDGAEGPGNYGLNKDCMMTIVAASNDTVTANFALVQPGLPDAPKIVAALAKTCGDNNPPKVEELAARSGAGRTAERMDRMVSRGANAKSIDLSQFDLNTEEGLRGAVRGLVAEVQRLRAEVEHLRGPEAQGESRSSAEPASTADTTSPRDPFPGAVPDDPKLNSLLRQMLRQSNDDATVDQLMAEMQAYVKGDEELTKQAAQGWIRVLHFGDRYGTAHARKLGQKFLQEAKQ